MSGVNSKLKTALDSQKYFVTISHRDNNNQLQHFWVTKNYLKDYLMPTLEHLKKEIYGQEINSSAQQVEERAGKAHGE